MSDLKWETPPSKRSGVQRYNWAQIAKELKESPGEWALLGDHPATNGTRIRKGFIADFAPSGSFEATVRNVVKNRGDLYVRYVGGESA